MALAMATRWRTRTVHTTPDLGHTADVAGVDFAQLARVDGKHWKFHYGRHLCSQHSLRVRLMGSCQLDRGVLALFIAQCVVGISWWA